MSLLLPDQVREEHDAQVREQMQAGLGTMSHWNHKLYKLDPFLQLVRAGENATHDSLTPGFWHIIRIKPPAPASVVLTCCWPDGSFREPGDWMLQKLKSVDLWDRRVIEEGKERARREQVNAEAQKLEIRAENKDEIMGRLKAYNRPAVPGLREGKWAPKAGKRKK